MTVNCKLTPVPAGIDVANPHMTSNDLSDSHAFSENFGPSVAQSPGARALILCISLISRPALVQRQPPCYANLKSFTVSFLSIKEI